MRNRTYFSIKTIGAGFTDQLSQFRVFYKLGLSLGYTYFHQPFVSRRSTAPREGDAPPSHFDVFDFLGFNEFFLARNRELKIDAPKTIEVPLGDDLVAQHNIGNLPALQEFIRREVAGKGARGRPVLVKFVFLGKRSFFRFVNAGIPEYTDGLDLRAVYFAKRREDPWPSMFPDGSVKVLLHIRQGDTALLDTPWQTYIPLWPRDQSFREYSRLSDIPGSGKLMPVEDFYRFFKSFTSHFSSHSLATLLFSDGFARAQSTLDRQIERLNLPPEEIEALREHIGSHDRTKFDPFTEIAHCKLLIGEEPSQLCHLIHSFFTADLVIIGPQQNMLLKLIAVACSAENMPVVLVLRRPGERRFKGDWLHLGDRKRKLIVAETGSDDHGDIALQLRELLGRSGPGI